MAKKNRAKLNAIADMKRKAGVDLENGRKDKYPSVCGLRECLTCGQSIEGVGSATLKLKCATPEFKIATVYDAVWAFRVGYHGRSRIQFVFRSLHDGSLNTWNYTSVPGMCMLKEDDKKAPYLPNGRPMLDLGGKLTANMMGNAEDVIEQIKMLCLGQIQCTVPVSRTLFGSLRDKNGDKIILDDDSGNMMSLSAVVGCVPPDTYEMQEAADQLAGYGLTCKDGCPTCVRSESAETNVTIECDENQVIFDIRDALYGAVHEAPEWRFDAYPGLCNVSATMKIPRGDMRRAEGASFIRQLKRRCLGRSQCQLSIADIQTMTGQEDPAPGFEKTFMAIATCRRQQLPFAAQELPPMNSFGLLHYEERLYDNTNNAVSLTDGFQMRLAFQSSSTVLRSVEAKNLTDFPIGVENIAEGSRMRKKIRRVLAQFTTDSTEGAEGMNFWKFKLTGSRMWSHGGVLSIMQPTFDADFCGAGRAGCDLSACEIVDDSCTFDVHLPGRATFFIMVYGLSAEEEVGDVLSLQYKPPQTCLFYTEKCADPHSYNVCKKLTQKEQAWHSIREGQLPWFVCRLPYMAEMLATTSETKPFCLDPDASFGGDLAGCWPAATPPPGSCEGAYDVASFTGTGLLKATTDADAVSTSTIHVNANGRCREDVSANGKGHGDGSPSAVAAASSLGAKMPSDIAVEHRQALLRFEEGPCDAEADKTNDPERKLRCTAKTYGVEANAKVMSFATQPPPDDDVTKVMGSAAGVLANGNLVADANMTGAWSHDGKSGAWAFEFSQDPRSLRRPLVVLPLPEKVDAEAGKTQTVAMWYRKDSRHVPDEGETVMAWAPRGVLNGAADQDNKMHAATSAAVTMSAKGGLRFFAHQQTQKKQTSGTNIYWKTTLIRCATLEEVLLPELADGYWHHFAVIIESMVAPSNSKGFYSRLTYVFDGATAIVKIKCGKEPLPDMSSKAAAAGVTTAASASLGDFSLAKLNAKGDEMLRELEVAGTDRVLFKWREDPGTAHARGALVLGGTYDVAADRVILPTQAVIDTVAVFSATLSVADISAIGADVPCAQGFTGVGFAFFPGTNKIHGTESLQSGPLTCNVGRHVVRYRYLESSGNGKTLRVITDNQDNAAQIDFPERKGMDHDASDVWAVTQPVEVKLAGGGQDQVTIDSDVVAKQPVGRRLLAASADFASSSRRQRLLEKRGSAADVKGFVAAPTPAASTAMDRASTRIAAGAATAVLGSRGTSYNKIILDPLAIGDWFGSKVKDVVDTDREHPPQPAPPPPPPYVDPDMPKKTLPDVCSQLASYRKIESNDMNFFNGSLISDNQCDHMSMATTGVSVRIWDRMKKSVFEYTYEDDKVSTRRYVIDGAAGAKLLQAKDAREILAAENATHPDELPGSRCGYKFPGYVQSYKSDDWTSVGGSSDGTVCFASNEYMTFEAKIPRSSCFLKRDIKVTNCGGKFVYELSVPHQYEIMTSSGDIRAFVTAAYFSQAKPDGFIPVCDEVHSKSARCRCYVDDYVDDDENTSHDEKPSELQSIDTKMEECAKKKHEKDEANKASLGKMEMDFNSTRWRKHVAEVERWRSVSVAKSKQRSKDKKTVARPERDDSAGAGRMLLGSKASYTTYPNEFELSCYGKSYRDVHNAIHGTASAGTKRYKYVRHGGAVPIELS